MLGSSNRSVHVSALLSRTMLDTIVQLSRRPRVHGSSLAHHHHLLQHFIRPDLLGRICFLLVW